MLLATLLILASGQFAADPLLPKLTPNQLYSAFSGSVGTVLATDSSQNVSQGTGWVLSPTTLVTCAHVVKDASEVEVNFTPGFDHDVKFKVKARLLAEDSPNDLALLKLERKVSAKPLRTLSNPFAFIDIVGTSVFVIGSPQGLDLTLSTGIVSNTHGIDPLLLQITAPVSHGSSGSPVLNDQGAVIGMVQSTVADGELLNLASYGPLISQTFDGFVRSELDSIAIEREAERVQKHFGSRKPGAASYELRRISGWSSALPVLASPRAGSKRIGVLLPEDVVSIVSIVSKRKVKVDKTYSYLEEWARVFLPGGKFGYADVGTTTRSLTRRLVFR